MTPYWLRTLKNRIISGRNVMRRPIRRRNAPARLSAELLEDRTAPAVNVLLVSPTEVTFTGTALNTTDLYLRVDRGVLEYSTNGRTFTRDLGSAPGMQSLTVTADTVIRVDISDPLADSGLPEISDRYRRTLFLGNMTEAGGTITSDSDLEVRDTATISTRRTRPNANQNTAPSTGDSLNLTLEAPHITVGTGARILAHADGSFTPGDVVFKTEDQIDLVWGRGIPGFQFPQADAGVTIGTNAVIKGNNVLMSSFASTAKLVEMAENLAENTRAVATADFNGDGKIDLVYANFGEPSRVYLNNGTADAFKNVIPIELAGAANSTSVAVGDINNDGRPDIVLGNEGEPNRFYLNNGTSNPFGGVSAVEIADTPHQTRAVALGDINQDGHLDLVVGNYGTDDGSGEVNRFYLNDGTGRFLAGTNIGTDAHHTRAIALGDLDNDGDLDAVTANHGSGEGTVLYEYDSTLHQFSTRRILENEAEGGTSLALGDLDNDGDLDVVVGKKDHENLALYNTGGTFRSESLWVNPGPPLSFTPPNTTSLALADLNGDGYLDLIAGQDREDAFAPLTGSVVIHMNNAGVSSTQDNRYLSHSVIVFTPDDEVARPSVAVADIDGDNQFDIAVGTELDLNVWHQVHVDADGNVLPADPIRGELFGLDYSRTFFITQESELRYETPMTKFGPLNVPGARLFAAAVIAKADANITVGTGARIEAANQLTLDTEALSNAEMTSLGTYFGAALGISHATANVIVHNGAVLAAGGNVDLLAKARNTCDVNVFIPNIGVPGSGESANITLAIADASSNSKVEVERGAAVSGNNARLMADNLNFFNSSTSGISFQTGGQVAAGLALAIGNYESNAIAEVNGELNARGDAIIDARSVNTKNVTSASTSIIGKLQDKGVSKLLAKKISGSAGTTATQNASIAPQTTSGSKVGAIKQFLNLAPGAQQFSFAGALGLALSESEASASIGPAARVTVGRDLSVTAVMEDSFQANASGSSGDAKQLSVGGALAISVVDNEANATIGENAVVNVPRTLLVSADALMPNQVEFFNFQAFVPDHDDPDSGLGRVTSNYNDGLSAGEIINLPVQTLLAVLTTGGQIGSNFATTFAASGGGGSDGQGSVGLAGAINIHDINQEANATIAAGAHINDSIAAPQDDQDVRVEARSKMESINLNGQFSILGFIAKLPPGTEEGIGVGGALTVGLLDNAARATIADGASVRARRDVALLADTFNYTVGAAQAGTKSEVLGAQGSISAIHYDVETLAAIDDQANITAGRDIDVEAEHTMTAINVTGGVSLAKSIGVGVSVSITDVDQSTRAFIGNANGSTGNAGTVQAGGDITVQADSDQTLVTVALSGGTDIGADQKPPSGGNSGPQGINLGGFITQHLPTIGSGGQQFGISVSGDVSFNLIETEAEAFIADVQRVTTGGDVTVDAENRSLLVGAGGGVVIGTNLGIGGSFAFNGLVATTNAYADETTLDVDGDLNLAANSDAAVVSAAAGVSANKSDPSVAGSATVKYLVNDTVAELREGVVVADAANVSVTAGNQLFTPAVAGAFALSVGSSGPKGSVGAAIDITAIDTTVRAEVGNGVHLNTDGNFDLSASSHTVAVNLAGALAITASGDQGFGASGSTAVQIMLEDVTASVGAGASVVAGEGVSIDAGSETDLGVLAGAGAGGRDAGVGLSVALSYFERDVEAVVGAGALVSAQGDAGVELDATAHDIFAIFAVSGAGSQQNAAVAASLVANVMNTDTLAHVDEGATVTAGDPSIVSTSSVRLNADHETDVVSGAGGVGIVAGSSGAGIGAALDTGVIVKNTEARVDDHATVTAAGDVSVQADAKDILVSATANIGGAEGVGVAGAVNVKSLTTNTQAVIDNHARVVAEGNVVVAADGDAVVVQEAGGVGVGQYAGVGLSNTTLVKIDVVEARIGEGATVIGLGHRPATDVSTGEQDLGGDNETMPLRGVAVTATSSEFLQGLAVGVGGSQNAAVAASGQVTVLVETTRATIDDDAQVNPEGEGSTDQRVFVVAADETRVIGIGGSGGISVQPDPANFGVGVGAGVDAAVLTKTTEATIDDDAAVNAAGDVDVRALSDETLIGVAASAGVGAGIAAGLAGAANVHVALITTRARVGKRAQVAADGNVVVEADDDAEVVTSGANLSVAGAPAVGATIAASALIQTTEALIDEGAVVNALGLRDGRAVRDGTFQVSYGAFDPDDPTTIRPPETIDASFLNDESLTGHRVAEAHTQTLKGVAVTATSSDEITTVSAGAAASVTQGLTLAGSAHVSVVNTTAAIANDARVNTSPAAGAEQSVLVAAGVDHSTLSIAGVGAVGQASAGAAGNLGVVLLDTDARIGENAEVRAARDIQVGAHAGEDALFVAAGFAVGGVEGSLGVYVLDSNTHATVNDDAVMDAGGNVLVSARDDTDVDMAAGAASFGFQTIAFGASLGLTVLSKDTQAEIGRGATINARGNTPNTMPVHSGAVTNDARTDEFVRGLAVQAISTEDVLTVAVGGAASEAAALAGSISVQIVASDTTALIAEGARINPDTAGAVADQTVNVSAANDVRLNGIAGAASLLSGAGLSGGIDLDVVQNNTTAYIGNDASVQARGDVEVHALSKREVDSIAISGTLASGIALAGSVSLLVLGDLFADPADASDSNGQTVYDGDARQALQGDDESTAHGFADGQTNTGYDTIDGILGHYTDDDMNGPDDSTPDNNQETGRAIRQVQAQLRDHQPHNAISAVVDSTEVPAGTSAFIGVGATIVAGRDVDVEARELVDTDQLAGAGALGLTILGVGGSVVVGLVGSHTNAYIDNRATVRAASEQPAGRVLVEAAFIEDMSGQAYAGGAGQFVGLGAQVVVLDDDSTQSAFLGNSTAISQAGAVQVRATADRELDAQSIGGGIGGLAAGISVALASADGSTHAAVASAQIGQQQGQAVRNVEVFAESKDEVDARTIAVGVGIVSGAGSVAQAKITPEVTAEIDTSARVQASNSISVKATADADAGAVADGVDVGAITVAGNIADADASPDVVARVGGNARLTATDGSLEVVADNKAVANAEAGPSSGTGGLLSAGTGATATANANADASALVVDGAMLEAGQNLLIRAESEKTALADSNGVTVGLLFGLGIIEADAAVGGVTSATTGNNSSLTAGGSVFVQARETVNANAETDAAGGGLAVAGNGSDADVDVALDVSAMLGNGSSVSAGQDVAITAESQSSAEAIADGITVGGLGAVSVSVANASEEGRVRARILPSGTVNAGGNVTVAAAHNTPGLFEDPVRDNSKGARARATASGGAALAGNGVNADAESDVDVNGIIDTGASVNASGNVAIGAHSWSYANANGDGDTFGAAASSGVVADANSEGTIQAGLGTVTLTAGGDLTINARGSNSARAFTDAASGGILSGAGADSDAVINTTVLGFIGQGSNVTAGGAVKVEAESTTEPRAVAEGDTSGGITVGISEARAELQATVQGFIDADATVHAGTDLAVAASHGALDPTPILQAQPAARATGSLGEIAGVLGAEADVIVRVAADAYIGPRVTATAGRDVGIATFSWVPSKVETTADLDAGLAIGGVDSDANVINRAHAFLGENARIEAGNNFAMASLADNDVVSNARGSGGGLANFQGARADSDVGFHSLVDVGAGTTVTTGGELELFAGSTTKTRVEAFIELEDQIAAFGSDVDTLAMSTIAEETGADEGLSELSNAAALDRAARTQVEVGSGASLHGRRVVMTASVLDAIADLYSRAAGPSLELASDVNADGRVYSLTNARVLIHDAEVVGRDELVLEANQAPAVKPSSGTDRINGSGVISVAHSDADTEALLDGTDSDATTVQFTGALVAVDAGAQLQTSNFTGEARTPRIVFDANAEEFAEIGGDTEETRRGFSYNQFRLDGELIVSGPEAVLEVDEQGQVVRASGIDYRTNGGRIDVDGVQATGTGSVTIRAGGPDANSIWTKEFEKSEEDAQFVFVNTDTLAGSGTLRLTSGPGAITIHNASNTDLVIHGLSSEGIPLAPGTSLPSVTFNSTVGRISDDGSTIAWGNKHLNLSQADGGSDIDIQNHGNSDIAITGLIDNPTGTTRILNDGPNGGIVTLGIQNVGPHVRTRHLELTSMHETGFDLFRFNTIALSVELVQSDGIHPTLTAHSGESIDLSVRGVQWDGQPLVLELDRLTARQFSTITILDGVNASGQTVRTTANLSGLTAGRTAAVTAGQADLILVDTGVRASERVELTATGGAIRSGDFLLNGLFLIGSSVREIVAPAAVLRAANGIGTGTPFARLETDIRNLEADAGSGAIVIDNINSLGVGGVSSSVSGLRAAQSISVRTTGALTLREPVVSPTSVGLTAGRGVFQDMEGASVVTGNLTVAGIAGIAAGDIGSAESPFTFDADRITTNTSYLNDTGDQFLRSIDEVDVGVLDAGTSLFAGVARGHIFLMGGTFVNDSTIVGHTHLTDGTLAGNGIVNGKLDVLGGTVSPGSSPGTLRTVDGDAVFDDQSAFNVEITGVDQSDRLQVDGRAELGGATLTGSVLADLPEGASVTILQAVDGVVGRFAQDSSVVIDGVRFTITYNPTSVVLTRNHVPVVSDSTTTILEDTPLSLASEFLARFGDADSDALAVVRVESLPPNGLLMLNGTAVALGQEIAASDLGSLVFAPDANWFGTTSFRWNASDGFEWAASSALLTVQVQPVVDILGVRVNDGSAQRSKVARLTITFDSAVTIDRRGLEIRRGNRSFFPTRLKFVGNTVIVEFVGLPGVVGRSLQDGTYSLILHAGRVHGSDGGELYENFVYRFHRRFGDFDGDGDVDTKDARRFWSAFHIQASALPRLYYRFWTFFPIRASDPGFKWYFDFDGNGQLDTNDITQFLRRQK